MLLTKKLPSADWVQLLKDLPQKSHDVITFKDKEITAMLGGNAAKLLKI